MNEYQVRAAEEALTFAKSLPLVSEVKVKTRGIVGGGFDVTVKRVNEKPIGEHFVTTVSEPMVGK
jgi:hypothetical protein